MKLYLVTDRDLNKLYEIGDIGDHPTAAELSAALHEAADVIDAWPTIEDLIDNA